jgi:nitrous oxidase accessory protein
VLLRGTLLVWLLLLPLVAVADLPPLQPLIDETPANETLVPPPGIYAGPVTLEFPITIDGQGQVTIDAGGKGTVVYVETDGASIKGLHLTNSGTSHNDIDSGVQIRGNFNVVKDCVIDDCLFGIDMQQSENNIIRRNTISSKSFDLGQRGDGIRLWYSFRNKIQDNVCRDVRDMVVWYSADNEITGNRSTGSRYSLHFMYSRFNLVENNWFYGNAVGIFLMYSDGVIVRGTHILHAAGPTGVGIGFKETSDLLVENNEILYCASGLYIDVSPFQPDTTNRFFNNTIAYNGVGVRFLNDWPGNIFKDNQFADNMTQVMVGGGDSANRNDWRGNYWSDYQGFDRNRDGIGDTPHEIHSYADRIWKDAPFAQFFKGTPMLETLDFLERLAPFTAPQLLVRDTAPKLKKEEAGMDRAGATTAAP